MCNPQDDRGCRQWVRRRRGCTPECMITFCAACRSSRLTRYVRRSPSCADCSTACAVANALAALLSREHHWPRPERCKGPAEQLRLDKIRAAIVL